MSYHIERGIDMTIETHTADRKALARQIAELLHEEVTYAGVPSCAYRIGAVTIDRSGAIHTDDAETLKTLKPFLIEQGHILPEPEKPEPQTASDAESISEPNDAMETNTTRSAASDIERMEISMPAENMTIAALKNMIFMLYSKQHLLNRATVSDVLTISDGVVARLKEYTPETPEAFTELLTDFEALGELDGFDFRDGNVTVAFSYEAVEQERWNAYGFLLDRIVKAALAAERVFPKKQRPDNEKYFMRSWLIRLGLGGVEFKALRSLLMKNLKGHTAFSDDAAALKHEEKYALIRRAARERQVAAE